MCFNNKESMNVTNKEKHAKEKDAEITWNGLFPSDAVSVVLCKDSPPKPYKMAMPAMENPNMSGITFTISA